MTFAVDRFPEAFMSFPAEIHAKAKLDARSPRLSLQRFIPAIVAVSMASVWTTTAFASCGNYLYRNGRTVTDSSFSMNGQDENHGSGKTPAPVPVRPCHGPNCSGDPIPLAPVPVAPTNLIRGFDQAAILETLTDLISPSLTIEHPESECGADFEPPSVFRPPAA